MSDQFPKPHACKPITESEWPRMHECGVQRYGDMLLELRTTRCCGSTLAIEIEEKEAAE